MKQVIKYRCPDCKTFQEASGAEIIRDVKLINLKCGHQLKVKPGEVVDIEISVVGEN